MMEKTKERIKNEAEAALADGWDGVLALCSRWGHVGPYLFTDAEKLGKIEFDPKYCLARTIRSMLENTSDLRMAAVVRGCDQRALRELDRIGRIDCKRLHFIGIDCSWEQAEECNCEKPTYETLDCSGCWKCLEACREEAIERINPCPILVPNEWDVGMKRRKAIYIPFPQAVPLAATRDSEHCLRTQGLLECKGCENVCDAKAVASDQEDEVLELEVGSIIVATGFDPLDPTPMEQYGYGKYANVFTNLEFERLSNATGPTSGKLLKRDQNDHFKFTEPPKSVAILHCIGSRDKNYHEYCSRTCCMYALKYAHLLKEKCGHDTQIYNFYIDMRCFGKGYEEFYKKVQLEGVRMIRGKAARVHEEDGMLVVKAEDTLSNSMVQVPVEMVILCTAMEARSTADEVSRLFNIPIGGDGFFLEEHPKLAPVSTASSGVFLAGTCQGPKDIPDTVAQAKGAAAECLAMSASGQVEVAPMISSIDPDICVGCQVCMELCPYTAIEFNELTGISAVNEAVCKGCGSCSGHCPSGAAKVRHFTDKQIFAEVDGILFK